MQQTDQPWRSECATISSLTAREVARALGGHPLGRDGVLAPGPGHSPRDRSLRVWLDPTAPNRFRLHSFAGDDPLLCRDYVRERLQLPEFQPGSRPSASLRRRPVRPTIEPDTGQQALAIWRGAISPRGTIAETYLKSRGLDLDAGIIGAVRFHAGLYFKGATIAGVVALFRDVLSNEPCGIHRTFLRDDGCPILDGAGKENPADAWPRQWRRNQDRCRRRRRARLAYRRGHRDPPRCTATRLPPVWHLGSASVIAAFPVLAGLDALTVFAENDDASNRAAETCGHRYENAGCEAWICEPPSGDMNDILIRRATA